MPCPTTRKSETTTIRLGRKRWSSTFPSSWRCSFLASIAKSTGANRPRSWTKNSRPWRLFVEAKGGRAEWSILWWKLYRRTGAPIRVLIHVEVQAQKDTSLEKRVFQCHARLMDHYYPQPVCSLVVLADKNPNWRPESYQAGLWGTNLHFRFPVVKLLDLKPKLAQLEVSPNIFARLVALTLHTQGTRPSSPVRKARKFGMLKGMYLAGFSREQIVEFFNLMDRMTRLSPELEEQFYEELDKFEKEMDMPYVNSIERIRIRKEREEARDEERKELARRMLGKQVDRALILEVTGLSEQELGALEQPEPES